MKSAFRELYIDTGLIPLKVFSVLERGMDLREMADYRETYSQDGANALIIGAEEFIIVIEAYIQV